MKTYLIIPGPPVQAGGLTIQSKSQFRLKLRLSTNHPASSYGLGVLLTKDREIFDGHWFRAFRDQMNARIETTHPAVICAAMGLPEDEVGIEQT